MSVIFNEEDDTRRHIHLVFVGHRDHGKSSILGRLFWETGNVGKDAMERIKQTAKEMGREGFEYAFVMDQIKEERMRGITIGLAHKKMRTDKNSYTFADAPGHKDFIRNMLIGASESEASIVVIAADEGIQEQTEQHMYLSKMMGVPRVIIALNKMDLVNYEESKYKQLKENITKLIKRVGYDPQEAPIIPLSAIEGDNIVKKTEKMQWYSGPSLFELIENLPDRKSAVDMALRLPIQDIYEINKQFAIIGRLSSGTISEGDEITTMPSGKKFKVKEIWKQTEKIKKALPGDNIYLYLDGFKKEDVKRGDIIGKEDNPIMTNKFKAQVMILSLPISVKEGFDCDFEMITQQTKCKVSKLLQYVDTRTGETKDNPAEIKEGESAIMIIETEKPVYIEAQSKNNHLSGFRLQENWKNIAMGICIEPM